MTTAMILDIILCVATLLLMIIGYSRGFIKMVAGLAALVIAFLLAVPLANIAEPYISKYLVMPEITRTIEEKVPSTLLSENPNAAALQKMLTTIGFSENATDTALKDMDTWQTQNRHNLTIDLAQSLSSAIVKPILVAVLFILILILSALLLKMLNLISKLPVLNFINRFLGMLIGLLFAYVICIFLIPFLAKNNIYITESDIESTKLVTYIIHFNVLDYLGGIVNNL